MAQRISDEELLQVVEDVVEKNRTVRTQRRLWRLVMERLAATNRSAAEERIRRLAAGSLKIRVETRTREDESEDLPSECPVCGSKLSTVKNQTLYGWDVIIERACPRCAYRTGRRRRVPVVYVFSAR